MNFPFNRTQASRQSLYRESSTYSPPPARRLDQAHSTPRSTGPGSSNGRSVATRACARSAPGRRHDRPRYDESLRALHDRLLAMERKW